MIPDNDAKSGAVPQLAGSRLCEECAKEDTPHKKATRYGGHFWDLFFCTLVRVMVRGYVAVLNFRGVFILDINSQMEELVTLPCHFWDHFFGTSRSGSLRS